MSAFFGIIRRLRVARAAMMRHRGVGTREAGIRVGVAPHMEQIGTQGGHGRVWSRGVGELARLVPVLRLDGNAAERPDIWLHNGHEPIVGLREPVVSIVHEARWVEPSLSADIDADFLSRTALGTADAVARSTRVIAPSFAGARNIAQLGVPWHRIDVVPYGVDLDTFRPGLAGGRDRVAAMMGDDRPYVVAVGTTFRSKNLPLLRDAVVRLQARGFPHRLVLVTAPSTDNPDSLAALDDLVSGEGSVAVFQKIPETEMAALVADAAAFCLPSRFEGFGLPALEALACGTPTIVSRGGALPEIVAAAGLVVDATLDAVEEALAQVLGDDVLAADLARKARARAELFPWQATAQGWRRSIERALEP